jgi:hypothetical protein
MLAGIEGNHLSLQIKETWETEVFGLLYFVHNKKALSSSSVSVQHMSLMEG